MKIGGLDIGTTGCKLTVFDENGNCLGKAYRDYPVRRKTGGHEIDISTMMDSVYAVLTEMAAKVPDLEGIGVTSFGETFVLTDAEGHPLHHPMLYTDPRGAEECRLLRERVGERKIARLTGLRPHEMYSLPKAMWLKKHRPEVYAQAAHLFLIGDYVVWHLTGKAQIDYSLASRTMGFDIRRLAWSGEMFAAAGFDPALMCQPVPTGTVAGSVQPEIAARTGLPSGCRIVTVSHDQVAASVGAGAFDASAAVDGAGTVECLTPVYDEVPNLDAMYDGYFSVVPYVIPGKYVAYAFSYTGGALIQWCVDTLAGAEKAEARAKGISVHQLLEEAWKGEGPTGLLVLPHFAGAATPYMDTGSRGAVLGLTTETTVAELYRACMEGVAYEMRLNADALAGTGICFDHLNATGGGARSAVWMQMKADILNLPIVRLRTEDAGTVGSAMLTGIAVGLFRDLAEAADVMIQQAETYVPDPVRHEAYMRVYRRYRRVYEAVRPLMTEQ